MDSSSPFLNLMPEELITALDSYLSFEESINFSQTCSRVRQTLGNNMKFYNKMILSDDPDDCILRDTRNRRSQRRFYAENAERVLLVVSSITNIIVLMKEVDVGRNPHIATSIRNCSPYTPGGFLSKLFGKKGLMAATSLKDIEVHVDVTMERFPDPKSNEMWVQCPTEDLVMALNLAKAPFHTLVQMSICCAEYSDSDQPGRDFLIAGMQSTLKAAHELGATVDFEMVPKEGYVDMTVDYCNMEYSFAFFYYNPSMCECAANTPSIAAALAAKSMVVDEDEEDTEETTED